MPLGIVHVDPAQFPEETMPCLRCGRPAPMRFAGPCGECTAELRATLAAEQRAVEGAEYVPKTNVTANAVALKDD